MTRILALALAPALMIAAPALAQSRNCDGALIVDSVSHGTQRVPRTGPESDQLTLTITVRNLSATQQRFTALYVSRAMQRSFLNGLTWQVSPGGRTEVVVGNVLKPGESLETVRQMMYFTCR